MGEDNERQIYRPKPWPKWLMLGLAVLPWAFWLVIVAFLVTQLGPLVPSLIEILGEEMVTYGRIATFAVVVLTVLITANAVYFAAFWWTFRVELDRQGITRAGLPLFLMPRSTMRYGEIERVDAVRRYAIRITPREGRPLALNLRMLEGGQSDLLGKLLERVPPDRVQSDLERVISEKWPLDRVGVVLGGVAGLLLVFLLASMLLGRQLRSVFAWPSLGGFDTEVFAVAVAPDGAIWMAIEGNTQPGSLGIRLRRQHAGEQTEIELPVDAQFPGQALAFDGFGNPIRSMVVDHLDQVWLVFRRAEAIATWDGDGWHSFTITPFGSPVAIWEVAQLGPEIWGFSRTHQVGFSIDPETDEIEVFNFIAPNQPADTALRVNPFDFQATVEGGLVITGTSTDGFPAIIHLTLGGTIEEMTALDRLVDLPDRSWSLDFGSADGRGNLYAIFTSPGSCHDDSYTARVAVRNGSGGRWTTHVIDRQLDCTKLWSLPSFAVDPHGRVWMAIDSSRGGGVTVHELAASSGDPEGGFELIRHYTEYNSNYNGSRIWMAPGGLIYAAGELGGRAVAIDASEQVLPRPAPGWIAAIWERPHLILLTYLGLVVFLTVRAIVRDRGRRGHSEAIQGGMQQDTKEVVFTQSPRQKRISVLVAILIPSVFLAIVLFTPALMGMPLDVTLDFTPRWFSLMMLAMPVAFGAILGYWAAFAWKDQLIITPDHIERRGLRHFRIYRGPVRFDDVTTVRRRSRGVLVIERREGRPFEIFPKAYEGGAERILEVLEERIPAEAFEPELSRRLYERTGENTRAAALFFGAVFLFFFAGFSDDLLDWIRRDRAWVTEVAAARNESMEDFALQEDGSLWLLVERRASEGRDPRNYQIRHFTASGVEVLEFPSLAVLYPQGLPENGGEFPTDVSVSADGEVRAFFFLVDTPLVWTGGRWQWEDLPQAPQEEDPFGRLARQDGSDYWARLASTRRFTALLPSTGEREEISLGEDESFSLLLERHAYGWSLARLRAQEERSFLLAYREEPAEATWVEVEFQGLPDREYWSAADVALGPAGSIHLLMQPIDSCDAGIVTVFVGRLGEGGQEGWVWRALEYPQDCERARPFGEMVVDARNRVLLQDSSRVAIFEPTVFEQQQSERSAMTLYTEENSGFYYGHRLQVGPDGRIWSLDISGDVLVWLEPAVEQLPRPLPSWVGTIMGDFRTGIALQAVGMGLFVIAVLMARREGRPGRSEEGRESDAGEVAD